MNVVVVTPYPPVLHMHGGGVRMFHNIRILAEKHDLHVFSFVENDHEMELVKSVEHICKSVTPILRVPDFSAHWFSLAPFMVREFGTPEMHKAVDEAVRSTKVDVIQCEYLQMAQFRRAGVFSILTAHEAYSANAYRAFQETTDATQKLRLFSRWMSMLYYETAMCNTFDRVVTMTEEDARYLRSYARRADIRAIPIGIDADYFQPSSPPTEQTVQVVFVGNFRHSPNVEAAEFLISEIAPHFPDIEVVIAGSNVPNTLRSAANVSFPGYVPDTRSLFHSPNTIFAAPLFSGTGQRVKLLEAFAMGASVVTTTIGAAGFPLVNGEHAMIADTPESFRAAISRLADSADQRAHLGKSARRMMLDRFTWNAIAPRFLELLDDSES
jgi:glycosyltransferase involved in cell wall biosynthesis